jgi:glycosyltransferase involved in cell wall biosynthesis
LSPDRSPEVLRLLYLGPFNSPHLEDLAIAMRERGHIVQAGGEVWGGGLPPSSLPQHGISTNEIQGKGVLWLRRVVNNFRPDVVHAHWMPFAALAALAGARPLVATAWGSDVYGASLKQRLLIRLALHRSAVAMADSSDLVMRLEELGPSSLRTMLVNWGVDLETFTPPSEQQRTELKTRFGVGPGPVVLSPRGLKGLYNPGMIVEAFKQVRAAVPNAQLVLKHGGVAQEMKPEWADAPGVKVIGRIGYDDMAPLFRAADVTVSIPTSDSSPRSVWEAMAAGSATVLSDLSWVHELVENERDALVVAPEVEPLASAIERLIRDRALRRRIVSSARQLVEKHRDRKTELARVERCYLELTASSKK